MARDDAAYAANWRTVLAVDLVVGGAALAGGVALLAAGTVLLGALLGALGGVYVVLVGRRYLRWRRLRGEAGL